MVRIWPEELYEPECLIIHIIKKYIKFPNSILKCFANYILFQNMVYERERNTQPHIIKLQGPIKYTDHL